MTYNTNVPMPEPGLRSWMPETHTEAGHHVYSYTADQLRAYADARCAELEAVIHERNQSLRKWADWCKEAEAERDALAEKVKAMEDDARRYRWLRSQMFVRRNAAVPDRYGLDEYLLSEGIDEQDDAKFIDAAIDAAGGDKC